MPISHLIRSSRTQKCEKKILNFQHPLLVTQRTVGAAAPPDFENPKKLSHKNAIKLDFSEKWGKIGLLAPPDFWSSRGPCYLDIIKDSLALTF